MKNKTMSYFNNGFKKTMRISVLLFLTFNLTVANSFSQNKVTLKVQNANVSQVLDEIEAKTDYMFIYQLDVYDFNKMISLNVKNEPITLRVTPESPPDEPNPESALSISSTNKTQGAKDSATVSTERIFFSLEPT